MQAATHAAGGVGATMGPKAADGMHRVRQGAAHGWESTMATLAPLAAAAAEGAREAGRTTKRAGRNARPAGTTKMRAVTPKRESRMSRRRLPMLAGLLAAGAALGAVGALVMRRRKQQQWQEYDPSQAMEPVAADADEKTGGAADPAMNGTVDSATLDGVVDSTKGRH
ncbi:hypothetical protein RB614_41995 [Phytohabitans sp. ZYX-F-186]|uniref:Gram-positive cocci surface proteins LPxTG domain-containing protein n=1 Tax=Phytohabitans maris TaxID=3071409 RepID=A0ABU0ZVL4_9ACTN|nr:hypothetical protein [Phytohabitans sp. ZYX-F-186]MDQ7911081.1 hypothetical protein [Phytohabitans sp. ZYX-F-186]